MRGVQGGIAVTLLGGALLILLLVGALGLAESARATMVKTRATRALAAAVHAAALEAPVGTTAAERVFHRILAANLAGYEYAAEITIPAHEGTVSGTLILPYRLEYLGRWLPAVHLRVSLRELRDQGWRGDTPPLGR